MTSPILWAVVALLAMAGWSAVLVLLSRSLLPMANALGALNRVDTLFDERVMKVLTRVRDRQERRPTPPKPSDNYTAGVDPAAPMRDIFGGGLGIEPIGDQPDSDDLEIIN